MATVTPMDFMASGYVLPMKVSKPEVQNISIASADTISDITLPQVGFAGALRLNVTASGGVGSSVFAADAPFNLLTSIRQSFPNENKTSTTLDDIDGYSLYLLNLLDTIGAVNIGNINYSLDTSNGNFSFSVLLPRWVSYATGVGVVGVNGSSQAPQLSLGINAASNIYTTLPTTLPTVNIELVYEYVQAPAAVSAFNVPQTQVPPYNGTIVTRGVQAQSLGGNGYVHFTTQGGLIRNWVLVMRDSSGARESLSGNFPDSLLITDNGNNTLDRIYLNDHLEWQEYALQNINIPTGVLFLPYSRDIFGRASQYTMGQQWRRTSAESFITATGSWPSSGNLQVITDMVSPALPAGTSLQNFFMALA